MSALYDRYAACHSGTLATSWTPWDGCTATIFGTEVKVGL